MHSRKKTQQRRTQKKSAERRTLSKGTTAIIAIFVVAVCLAIVLCNPPSARREKFPNGNIAQIATNENFRAQRQKTDESGTRAHNRKTSAHTEATKKTHSEKSADVSNKNEMRGKKEKTIDNSQTPKIGTKKTQSENTKTSEHFEAKNETQKTQSKAYETKPKTLQNSANANTRLAKTSIPKPSLPSAAGGDSKNIPNIPPAVNHAELVFVFDDAGQNLSALDKYLSLPFPISVAVLPQLPNSRKSADAIRATKNEVLLHQPMQALNKMINPGPGAVTPNMTSSEIANLVAKNIESIGGASGINNHEGSLISEDEMKIGTVMQTANERGMFFLDSRTTSQTRVPQASMELGIPYYERNVFLDNTSEREKIIGEILRGLKIANQNGSAIMIGHIWSSDILPDILSELYPTLRNKGYTFSTVSKSRGKKLP